MSAEPEGPMSFRDHLEELRGRILRATLAVIAGMVVGWNFREQLFAWLLRPLEVAWFCNARESTPQACTIPQIVHWMLHYPVFRSMRDVAQRAQAALPANAAFPLNPQVHFPDPTSAFVVYLKIAAIGGFVLALPVVFYQLWMFIAPGLYAKEKRVVLPLVFFSTVFFLAGSLFGYHFVFPVGYAWFLGFSGKVGNTAVTVIPTLMMDEYLSFTSQMLLAFGVVFELPLFIFFLSLVGLVTWRQLLSFSRYFTVIAFILAAVLTPSTDVYSQVMLGLPLIALYFVAVFLAYLFGPKEAKPWRQAVSNTLKKRDEVMTTEKASEKAPEKPRAGDADALREAKIRDHEARVAAKIAVAKAKASREK
ncbi:MAG: twin-arginine translocase subunit TatC [Deltaproteobacteria bacterium]|nr:twin-arginine translocase subunit TatC [Myxococcales bacterium]MDP3214463.1 twin-arginine translocase subunit TatC [Deltaproteobacteria bacterium]